MKILFPTGSFFPAQTGGPDNTVYWMTQALQERGVQPTVVTSNNGIADGRVPLGEWLSTDYGRVVYFPEAIHYLPVRLILTTLREVKRTDLIHLTAFFYPPSWISAAWAAWLGKPVVWSPRGGLSAQALAFGSWKKRPVLWLIRRFLAGQVVFHATSEQETAQIKKAMGRSVRIVQLPNYLLLPGKLPVRPQRYLLFLGRIHPIKAIDRLLAALPASEEFMNSDFQFIIAGAADNPYGCRLKAQVRNLGLEQKVKFIGHVEGAAKWRLLAGAYFSFLPSHSENFGNVVIEALSQGTPVVASTGTPWQLLEARQAGFQVRNTPVRLAKIIDYILSLPDGAYAAMRKNAYQTAVSEFDIHNNIDRWLNVYRSLTGTSPVKN